MARGARRGAGGSGDENRQAAARPASAGAARSGNVSGRPGDRVFSGNGRGAGFGVEGDPGPARQTAPRGRVSQPDLDVVLVLLLLDPRSEEHTSELQSQSNLVCRLLLEKKKKKIMLTNRYKYNTSVMT